MSCSRLTPGLFLLCSLLLVLPVQAASWPTKNWQEATGGNSVVRPQALEALYRYAFPPRPRDRADQSGVRTDAVLIIKHGLIQAERYYQDPLPGYGYDRNAKHLLWSATKSFANALAGIAVQNGKLRLDTPIGNYYPEANRRGVATLHVHHALEFSTCLDWTESYEGEDHGVSSVLAMLYGPGHSDIAHYTAKQEYACQPGTRALYSSGDSNLLMGVLKRVYGAQYSTMPWRELFDRIGMRDVTFEQDASGTFVGSSYLYVTARDLAKFGYLYLHDGVWDGRRILPPGWVRYSSAPSPAYLWTTIHDQSKEWVVGPNWWSNATVPAKGFGSTWPAAPEDMFVASGHWGQRLWVIPSRDTVIVRLGDDRDGQSFDDNEFLKLALEAIEE